MITAVAFVTAAAVGALARAEAGRRWNRHDGFAVGTIVVNITGSFLLSTGYLSGAHDATCPVYRRVIAAKAPWSLGVRRP